VTPDLLPQLEDGADLLASFRAFPETWTIPIGLIAKKNPSSLLHLSMPPQQSCSQSDLGTLSFFFFLLYGYFTPDLWPPSFSVRCPLFPSSWLSAVTDFEIVPLLKTRRTRSLFHDHNQSTPREIFMIARFFSPHFLTVFTPNEDPPLPFPDANHAVPLFNPRYT